MIIKCCRQHADANRVLSIASVIGRVFSLNVLRRVAGGIDDEFEDGLEEAVAASIVEGRTVMRGKIAYRFTHAFFRQPVIYVSAGASVRSHFKPASLAKSDEVKTSLCAYVRPTVISAAATPPATRGINLFIARAMQAA